MTSQEIQAKDIQYFIKKEYSLIRALKKVDDKLKYFSEFANKNFHSKINQLSIEEIKEFRKLFDSWNWNEHHDLRDRLNSRIIENSVNAGHWGFCKNGFSIVSIQ
jgi:hypothetical protein